MVDIPFAPFFLSHMLEKMHYNYLDELASFDQQMYSSLNFIKVCIYKKVHSCISITFIIFSIMMETLKTLVLHFPLMRTLWGRYYITILIRICSRLNNKKFWLWDVLHINFVAT